MINNFACIGSTPLLWKGMFLFVPLMVIILVFLGFNMALRIYLNMKKKRKLVDFIVKIHLIWFSVAGLSLITYGLIGLDFNFYLLVFFVTTLLILGAFHLGERLNLFRVHHSRWIALTILAIIFAVFFVICFVSTVRENSSPAIGRQTSCINRSVF